MPKQKAAPTLSVTRQSTKKTCTSIVVQHYSQKQYQSSEKSKKSNFGKHYPHSQGSVNLSTPCPYCDYTRGLIIIRFQDDKGFVRCGRCDAALFSLAEDGEVAK